MHARQTVFGLPREALRIDQSRPTYPNTQVLSAHSQKKPGLEPFCIGNHQQQVNNEYLLAETQSLSSCDQPAMYIRMFKYVSDDSFERGEM